VEYVGFFYNLLFGIIALFGGIVFTWWWLTIGKASDVYQYTTLMLFGFAINCGVAVFTRHLIWRNPILATDIANSWWYTFRTLPEFFAMSCIVLTMGWRTFKILRNSRKGRTVKKDMEKCDFPHPRDNPFMDNDGEE
jgi:hypothetical protein